jgi:hypothetical protein
MCTIGGARVAGATVGDFPRSTAHHRPTSLHPSLYTGACGSQLRKPSGGIAPVGVSAGRRVAPLLTGGCPLALEFGCPTCPCWGALNPPGRCCWQTHVCNVSAYMFIGRGTRAAGLSCAVKPLYGCLRLFGIARQSDGCMLLPPPASCRCTAAALPLRFPCAAPAPYMLHTRFQPLPTRNTSS